MKKSILALTLALASTVAMANPLVGDINNTTTTAGNNAAIVANDLRNNLGVNDNNFSNTPTNISANSNDSSASAIGNKLDSKITSSNNLTNNNDINATNTNDVSNKFNGSNTGYNTQGQTSSNTNGQGQSTENANNSAQSVNVDGDSYVYRDRLQAPAMFAGSLVGGECSGSVQGGVVLPGFGFQIGGTKESVQCDIRLNSVRLQQLGKEKAATYILCDIPASKKALEKSGFDCKDEKAVAQAAADHKPVNNSRGGRKF